jgi:TM2 domain-containing membrane protein YozV
MNRYIAIVLAFLFGLFGAHKLFLGRPFQALLHFLTGPLGWFWAIYEGTQYLRMNDEEFEYRYGINRRIGYLQDKELQKEQKALLKQQLISQRKQLEREQELQELFFKERLTNLKRNRPLSAEERDQINIWEDLHRKGLIDLAELEKRKNEILDR